MTDFQNKIIEFIKSSEKNRRFLCEFENVIPVSHNKRYEWQVRGSLLGKMVKKGIIKSRIEGKRYNRQTIYYYI